MEEIARQREPNSQNYFFHLCTPLLTPFYRGHSSQPNWGATTKSYSTNDQSLFYRKRKDLDNISKPSSITLPR